MATSGNSLVDMPPEGGKFGKDGKGWNFNEFQVLSQKIESQCHKCLYSCVCLDELKRIPSSGLFKWILVESTEFQCRKHTVAPFKPVLETSAGFGKKAWLAYWCLPWISSVSVWCLVTQDSDCCWRNLHCWGTMIVIKTNIKNKKNTKNKNKMIRE